MISPTTRPPAGRPAPQAGGRALDPAIADQAADWLTLFMSGEASDHDRQRWSRWRSAHPDHDRAWRHIEEVTGRLRGMDSRTAYPVLSPYADASRPPPRRRAALRALLWGGVAGAAGLLAARTPLAERLAADYRTGIGERRTVMLADGTALTLNTASAVDLRFDGRQRLLLLRAGEVLIATGRAASAIGSELPPFVVASADGRIRALGTRFTVRQHAQGTEVTVLESAVEIAPFDLPPGTRVLEAGQRLRFTRAAIGPPQPASDALPAWSRGQLVADNMRLDDFLEELGRYRPGLLRCAPEVAGLRLSGVFPVQDTDRILATLPSVLPVQVAQRTRFWVTVEAAP